MSQSPTSPFQDYSLCIGAKCLNPLFDLALPQESSIAVAKVQKKISGIH